MINGFKKFGCRGRLFAGAALMALFAGGLAAPTAAFADPSDGQPENGWPLSATITVGGSYGWDPPGTTSMDPDDPVEVDTCEPVTFYYFLYNMLREGSLSDVTITDGDVSIYVGSIGEGDEHDRQATIDLDPGPFDRTLNVTGSYRWETLGGDYETRYFTTTTHFYGVGLPCEQQAPIAGDASTTINPDETATLTPEVTPGSGAITTATFDNGETTKVVPGEGTWEISVDDEGNVTATFTPEDGYFGPVTPQEYTATDENGLTASGELSVEINDPPQAGDDSATINPGETATLNPEVTPGTGAIESVVFDNGETTKVVPGEGTWEISVDGEGNVTATFTPEDGYTGDVTPQEYTVTDENGLTASGELSVEINDPPQAEDASTSVPQGETATLKPVVTPGNSPIVDVTFADGSTEIVVPGEGTWTIELNDAGEVVATFTPEPDFYGVATPQEYIVTDENGLTATAELAVTVIGTKPSMDLVKSAHLNDKNGNGKADEGETIDYSFLVTNTGNTQLTDVGVDDPMLAQLGTGVTCSPTTLDPGGKAECAADKAYTVTAQDVKNGKVYNVATAHGTPPEGIEPPAEPKADVEVPTGPVARGGLAVTGGQVMWPMIGAGVFAVLAGGLLLLIRRRNRETRRS